MNLIVGATGELGSRIARRLLAQNRAVRILTRESSNYWELERAGAEVVFGDLKNPETLAAACRDVSRVLTTASASMRGGDDTLESVDREGTAHLIEAAKQAGTGQFVYVSAYGFEADSPLPLARYKAENEQRLKNSGLNYTILKPTMFMEVWIGFLLGSQLQQGGAVTILGDGNVKHAFVAIDDVADLAVAVLGHDAARNAEIPLSSPTPASYRDIIALIEEATGYPIEVHTVELGQEMPGLPPLVTELWTMMIEAGDVSLDVTDTANTFDLRLKTVPEYVRETFGPRA